MVTSEQSFNLVFFPAHTRRLIPMNFSEMNGSVRESNLHDAFPFAPATLAIELPKASNLSNSRPNRECFNLRDGAKQLKIHNIMVPKIHSFVNGKDGRSAKTAAPPSPCDPSQVATTSTILIG